MIRFTLLLLLAISFRFSHAQDMDNKVREMADVSIFEPDRIAGWSVYNSYFQPLNNRDSVLIELIVRHERKLNWSAYQHVGKIKDKKFIPRQSMETIYYLLSDSYKFKIDKTGNCYIMLLSGQLPPQDPVILPIRFIYRRT